MVGASTNRGETSLSETGGSGILRISICTREKLMNLPPCTCVQAAPWPQENCLNTTAAV